MPAKVQDLAQLPDWPRCLSREQAAAYVGVSPGKFDREVAEGIWPPGEQRGGRTLWDRVLLDRVQDERSGLVPQSAPTAAATVGSEWAGWS